MKDDKDKFRVDFKPSYKRNDSKSVSVSAVGFGIKNSNVKELGYSVNREQSAVTGIQ